MKVNRLFIGFFLSLLFTILIFDLSPFHILTVKANPTYQNYLDYTEVDVGADRIQRTGDPSHDITHLAYRDEDTYVYKDFGVGHFTDFEHLVDTKPVNQSGTGGMGFLWGLANLWSDVYGLLAANEHSIWIELTEIAAGNRIRLGETKDGSWTFDSADFDFVFGTWYYLRIKKVGTASTCKIYDTSASRDDETADAHLLDTLSLTITDDNWRYIYACNSYNSGDGYWFDYDVRNLDLQEEPPTNDYCTLEDADSGYCLAKKKYYDFQVKATDPNGISDFNYIEIRFETTSYGASVRWTQATDSFSETDASGYIEISGCTDSDNGNQKILHFKVRFDWDYPSQSLRDCQVYSIDDSSASDTDTYSDEFKVETDLTITSFAVSDAHVDVSDSVTFTGNVRYAAVTGTAPPDAQISHVYIHDADHNVVATDSSTSSGAFSCSGTMSSSVTSTTYHPRIDGAGDFTDVCLTEVTKSVITDRIEIYEKDDPIIASFSPTDMIYSDNVVVGPQNWYGFVGSSFVPLMMFCAAIGFLGKRFKFLTQKRREVLSLVFIATFIMVIFFIISLGPMAKGQPPASNIGYELLDNNKVLHIWNRQDSYYFNVTSGVQFSNHYEEYWSHNVLMVGHYAGDQWHLIYRTDELSGFNRDVESDNETYVNATLWKDLAYSGYDFRLAIRYHLGVDDAKLTVQPYIKNLGVAIGFDLGFAWRIKGIKIANDVQNDELYINNTSYFLNQTLDITYKNMTTPIYDENETIIGYEPIPYYYVVDQKDKVSRELYFEWNENLNYLVQVKSIIGQYNAPVTLAIKVGTLGVNQEKTTSFYWKDADWTTPDTIHSKCGETGGDVAINTIDDNTGSRWLHGATCEHWIIFDMSETVAIEKIRIYQGASDRWAGAFGLYVYVGDNPADLGSSVWDGVLNAEGWQESGEFSKSGRYVKLVSKTGAGTQYMYEFDAYVEPPDATSPTYDSGTIAHNTTVANNPCLFSCNWSDNIALSGYYFSTNNTGSWENNTFASFSGTWANETKTLNATVGQIVGYKWYANDTSNNWNGSMPIQTLTTTYSAKPQYSNVDHNATLAGDPCKFSCYWTDDQGLSGYIFGTNNTGTFMNETWSTLSDALTAWTNITKTLNITIVTVQYQFWCNDTQGQWNNTGLQSLTTTYSNTPQYSNANHNTTIATKSCLFSCYWTDDYALSYGRFGCNNTGSWVNETWSSLSGTTEWINYTKTLNSTIGIIVQYQWWCNDSQNQFNDTGLLSLTVTNPTAPTSSNIATSTTNASASCTFSCYWTDNVELSGYIFSTNNTGSWVNETWASLSGVSDWANKTKTLNSTIHLVIGFRWYCNDTGDNWGDSTIQTIYLLSSKTTSVEIDTYVVIWFKARYEYSSNAYTDASGSTLSINGTLATYDSTAGYWWLNVTQSVEGNYTYVVSAISDGVYGLTVINDSVGGVEIEWYKPNTAPTNEGCQITNMDDTNYLYSMKRYYQFEGKYNDTDGTNELDHVMIAFTDGVNWVNMTFNVQTDSWSLVVGSDVSEIDSGSCSNSTSGNQLTATWHIRLWWNISDASNIELYQYCNDTSNAGPNWQEKQTNYANIETDLTVSGFACDDDRGDISQSITFTGTIYYEGTSTAPPDNVFSSVHIYDSGDNDKGNDNTISSGAFSVSFNAPATVGIETYNAYINMTHESYTDNEDSNTDTFITDQCVAYWTELNESDSWLDINTAIEVRYKIVLDYDDHVVTSGDTVNINGSSATWDATGYWKRSITQGSVGNWSFTVSSVSEADYGITSLTTNCTDLWGVWDNIVVSDKGRTDDRTNVDEYEQFWFTLRNEFNSTFIQSSSVTLNGSLSATWKSGNSRWEYNITKTSPQHLILYVASVNWDTYGITSLSDQTSNTTTIVWDRMTILFKEANDTRLNINDNVEVRFKLRSEYDNTQVQAGSLDINSSSATWDASNLWWDLADSQSVINNYSYYVSSVTWDTYGITALNSGVSTNYTYVVFDRAVVYWTEVPDNHVNIDGNIEVRYKIVLDYDDHVVTSGDTVNINGSLATWDATGYWKRSISQATEGNWSFAVSSVSEVTYGITAMTTNCTDLTGIWDSLIVYNIQTVTYLGDAQYQYEAQIKYGYDSNIIDGAYVNVSLPSGSSIGQVTSNSSGWITFVLTQTNATETGVYDVYGVNDNGYGITVASANQTLTLRNWTLNSQDYDGNDLSSTTLTIEESSTTVYNSGDAVIRIPDDTFNITITWQSIQVNTTTNLAISGDTTTNFNCTVYPYTYESVRYWTASNATISSKTWTSNLLTLTFSDSLDTYIIKASCTTKPIYVLNCTYDYASDWTTILTLTHYANATIKIKYANWGGFYISKTDKRLITISWTGEKLSMTFTGTSGDVGQLKLYCASRGPPASYEGFTTGSYASSTKIWTGTYSFASDKTVSTTWSTGGDVSPSGGSPTGTTGVANILIAIDFFLEPFLNPNSIVEGAINVKWTGATTIYVYDVKFGENVTWFSVSGLPFKLQKARNSTQGEASITVMIQVPGDAVTGEYNIPCMVVFRTEAAKDINVGGNLTFEVLPAPSVLPEYLTFLFLGCIVLILLTGLARKKRK